MCETECGTPDGEDFADRYGRETVEAPVPQKPDWHGVSGGRGGAMNAPKPAEDAYELLNVAGNGREAVEGARRTFWDSLEGQGRSKGETTASIDGVQPWMPRRVARFPEDPRNRAVAERLYRDDPEHRRHIEKITDALQTVDTRLRARATGSSGTAQGVGRVLSPKTLQSRLYAD